MQKNGFISMTTILTIIVAVSAILIINIDMKMQKNNLLNKIKNDARSTIKNSDLPNCVWSSETTMVKSGDNEASNTIYITCTHVDKVIANVSITDLENIDNVNNYFIVNNNLKIDFIKVYELDGGYKVVLGLSTNVLNDEINGDNYTIFLKENIFSANGIGNEKIESNNIRVVKEIE